MKVVGMKKRISVILRDKVPSVGHAGDIVTVKRGYYRNYLAPKGLALHASRNNLHEFQTVKALLERKLGKEMERNKSLAERIEGLKDVVVHRKAGTNYKLYGSVTNKDIAQLINEKLETKVDRRDISVPEPIKTVGKKAVKIKLSRDVVANFTFEVAIIADETAVN